MAGLIKNDGRIVSNTVKQSSEYNVNILSGVYIGVVKSNSDSLRTGRITVHISDFGAHPDGADRICLLCTPMGGHNNIKDSGDDETKEAQAPFSYGIWTQPPEIGTNVVVAYTGSQEQGIVLGSLIAKDRNSMMGGKASGSVYTGEGSSLGPAVEKNPYDANDADTKPLDEYQMAILNQQGLSLDFVRGHSMSSARRESPSKVFGITTRGGHVLTLDDGDAQGDSQNIRLRTKGGAQILIDDSNNFIFVTTQNGDSWFEMNQSGKIDVYSKGGISYHTEGDYNIHAKGSINMQAEMGVNIKSSGADGIKLETSVGSIDVYSALNLNMQADANHNLKVAGNIIAKGTRVDYNGPEPTAAVKTTVQNQSANSSVKTSTASRVPEKHPWLGAEGVQETFVTGKGNTA